MLDLDLTSPMGIVIAVVAGVILLYALWAVVMGTFDAVKEKRSVGVLTALIGLIVAAAIVFTGLTAFQVASAVKDMKSRFSDTINREYDDYLGDSLNPADTIKP